MLLAIRASLFVVCWLLFVVVQVFVARFVCGAVFAVCCLLFAVCCLLFVVCLMRLLAAVCS